MRDCSPIVEAKDFVLDKIMGDKIPHQFENWFGMTKAGKGVRG